MFIFLVWFRCVVDCKIYLWCGSIEVVRVVFFWVGWDNVMVFSVKKLRIVE